MGVRGLTTYVYNNSKKFFDNFELQNSDLVIDGNCLVSVLFQNSISNTCAFGGDYDRFAKAVENFFNELLKCSINPYVIFDGGYEKKKLSTVYNRNKSRMLSLNNLGPTSHSKTCFPLMMRQVFRDKLREMSISFAQSDFEADSEIAALARNLRCPVLSNDSDFFIYDVTLIPVNEFSLQAVAKDDGSFYISCLVYNVENFLHSLGSLPKSHLPLLAALLGNDYISSSTFSNFYSQMKITRGKKQSHIQSRVQAIISWLKKETFESALKKIFGHLKKNRHKVIAHHVAKTIQDYNQVSTPLHAYLMKKEDDDSSDIEILHVEDIMKDYDYVKENYEDEEIECDRSAGSDNSNSDLSEHDETSNEIDMNVGFVQDQCDTNQNTRLTKSEPSDFREVNIKKDLPPWLVDHSRKGNVASSIITLFSLKIYFNLPQAENYDLNHAGEVGIPVISKIAGILLGDDIFTYYHRNPNLKYVSSKIQTVTYCGKKKIPHVTTLNNLNMTQRRALFLDIFDITSDILVVINELPDSWSVFLLSFIFWTKNIKGLNFQSYHLHSIIIMIVCIGVIEGKIGYYRNRRPFMQRFAGKIKKIDSSKKNSILEYENVIDIIEGIPLQECLIAFEILLPYFQIEERLKTQAKLFSKNIIHAFAQFQVCIDLAYTLNSFLMNPFEYNPIYNLYNGTYLYNFCSNFKKRPNLTAYLDTLLCKCPNILHLYKKIFNILSKVIPLSEIENTKIPRKRRKKKRSKKLESSTSKKIEVVQNESDEATSYSDEDNVFSVLAKRAFK